MRQMPLGDEKAHGTGGKYHIIAADAAEEVIELCGGLGVNNLDPDYQGLFLNPESPEIIFQRLYNHAPSAPAGADSLRQQGR